MQKAIMRKDLNNVFKNKDLRSFVLLIPIIFAVVIPIIAMLIVYFLPEDNSIFQMLVDILPVTQRESGYSLAIIEGLLNYLMPMYFVIVPLTSASLLASTSFAGEKEKRTLETLLYSPLSLGQIFRAKVFASFVLSMVVTYVSFAIMVVLVKIATFIAMGTMAILSLSWIIILLIVSPAITMLSITLVVGSSAKAKTSDEAQQRSAFLILPIMLILVGQIAGLPLINVWLLLVFGGVIAILAVFTLKHSLRNFTYEKLLR
jgi:ABC-type Na+ efflux pump permease subunit